MTKPVLYDFPLLPFKIKNHVSNFRFRLEVCFRDKYTGKNTSQSLLEATVCSKC